VIRLRLRDKQSPQQGIEDMAGSPSPDELRRLAASKIQQWMWTSWPCVKEAIDNLKKRKSRGGITVDFADLSEVICSSLSRVKDIGEDANCWTVLIEGTTNSGDSLQVTVILSKDSNVFLQVASFHPRL